MYHVLNRANGRATIFANAGDYLAFERTLAEVQSRIPMRILAWCLMPNHWHLVLWPSRDGELSDYVRLLTLIHTARWHAHHATAGSGHLYQGRFKSFAVQHDAHFLAVCRYVESNALNARLVPRAEEWRWSSLWRACNGYSDKALVIHQWPVARPIDWVTYVNEPARPAEMQAVRDCARRGRPYGDASWTQRIAGTLGLECKLRPRGRPKKGPDPFS